MNILRIALIWAGIAWLGIVFIWPSIADRITENQEARERELAERWRECERLAVLSAWADEILARGAHSNLVSFAPVEYEESEAFALDDETLPRDAA